MNEQDELLHDFLVETRENLDNLDHELLALEQSPADAELINAIFRRLHTIKGVCGFLDLRTLESVSHAGESLLQTLRSQQQVVTDHIITLLLTLCDAIRTIVLNLEQHRSEGAERYEALVSQLTAAAARNSEGAGGSEPTLEEQFQAILAERAAAERAPEAVSVVVPVQSAPTPPSAKSAADSREVQPPAVQVADSIDPVLSAPASPDTYLRVDVELLDQLMNLAGELVLARNQILQSSKNHADQQFRAVTQRLNVVTSKLQEGVMKTRMQPINTVWGKLPRVVRDLALSCKKQVRLEMFGKETELDKTLIEAIKDPLTHIVRNSIDHGIEGPEKRRAAGKNPEGCISLAAYQEGGYVIIEIRDDGAGLNTDKIRERGVERGLVSRERAQSMSEAEVHRLIFAPGFSTADTVTNLSGRGVGMDVVKSSVERISGQVDLVSTYGAGTTLRLKIPLTLAIIPALLLACVGQTFAVPQSAITELLQIGGSGRATVLNWIGDAPFYRLRGDLLPVIFLAQQLGLGPPALNAEREQVLVVIEVDGCRFGVVVDGVLDTEEIVVKPLGRQLKNLHTFAGATILGDGQIALILDPVVLARQAAIQQGAAAEQSSTAKDLDAAASEREQLLIVQVSSTMRAAIPLNRVKRLEEFRSADLEHVGGVAVVQYRGSILQLVDAGAVLGEAGGEQRGTQVVVVEHESMQFGVCVQAIVDISAQVSAIKEVTSHPGIASFGVVQGRVLALLNMDFFARCAARSSESGQHVGGRV
jgi:two-component system chemotaxis sensor kinase CheA